MTDDKFDKRKKCKHTFEAGNRVNTLPTSFRQQLDLRDVDAEELSLETALGTYHSAQALWVRLDNIFQRITAGVGRFTSAV